jgi:hypothetical protein
MPQDGFNPDGNDGYHHHSNSGGIKITLSLKI